MKPNFWREFKRQEDVVTAIQIIVNSQPFDSEFEAPLISQLISERHYFCSLRGLRPLAFKKVRGDGVYDFYGFFERHGWHRVSWRKSLKPAPSAEETISTALRNRTEGDKIAYRKAHPRCEGCGLAPSAEVHHAEPTFHEITERIFASVQAADIDTATAHWDWFKSEAYSIPSEHVITELFDKFHATARLEALCKECHKTIERNRRATRSRKF